MSPAEADDVADPNSQPEAIPAKSRSVRNWLGWGLALFILAGCAFFVDLGEVARTLGRVHPAWIVGILALMTVDRVVMAWKWSILLRVIGVDLPLSTITRYYYQGTLSGVFLPSGLAGDVLRAHWVSRSSGVTHAVYASLIMEKVVGFLSALSWAIAGAVYFACTAYPDWLWSWIGAGVLAMVAVNGFFALSVRPSVHDWFLTRLPRPDSRVFGALHRVYEAYAGFSNFRGVLVRNALLTVGEHLLQMVVVLLIARSLGIETATVTLLAITAVHMLIYRLPISPDGWGVGELSAIALYGLVGVGVEAAFAIAFLAHILQMVVVLPGFVFLLRKPAARPESTKPDGAV